MSNLRLRRLPAIPRQSFRSIDQLRIPRRVEGIRRRRIIYRRRISSLSIDVVRAASRELAPVTFRYRHTRHALVVFATHAAGVPREITRRARTERGQDKVDDTARNCMLSVASTRGRVRVPGRVCTHRRGAHGGTRVQVCTQVCTCAFVRKSVCATGSGCPFHVPPYLTSHGYATQRTFVAVPCFSELERISFVVSNVNNVHAPKCPSAALSNDPSLESCGSSCAVK